MSSEVYTGNVIWFKFSMGFIEWSKDGVKQKDMFVHYSDINMAGYKTLIAGQKVSFEVGINHKNQPKAVNVQIIE